MGYQAKNLTKVNTAAPTVSRLGKQMTWVHGARNRWMVRANRFLPRSIMAWAAGRVLAKRLQDDDAS